MTREPDQAVAPPAPRLSPEDAAAVDGLFESGLKFEGLEGPRVMRAARLLELLGGGPIDTRSSLADVTFARVMRAADAGRGVSGEPTLCPDDQDALDAWIMNGHDAARTPSALRARAHRHEALAGLVAGSGAIGDAASLAERTLARLQVEIDSESDRLDFGAASKGGARFRWADVISVAAVLLIGASVVWPVLSAMRDRNQRALCLGNLTRTSEAMASYAGAYRDSLPMTRASLGPGRWWDVGSSDHCSNSANLFTLARDGYLSLANLACPGNPQAPTVLREPQAHDWRRLEEISYSMQLVYGPARRTWAGSAPLPVLADRSPVVLRAVRGEMVNTLENAPNHGGEGQHLLMTDGSVLWVRTPVLANGDNIWLPRSLELRLEEDLRQLPAGSLSGRELPDGADDTFLGP